MDGKKLVIRQPIKKKYKEWGKKYSLKNIFFNLNLSIVIPRPKSPPFQCMHSVSNCLQWRSMDNNSQIYSLKWTALTTGSVYFILKTALSAIPKRKRQTMPNYLDAERLKGRKGTPFFSALCPCGHFLAENSDGSAVAHYEIAFPLTIYQYKLKSFNVLTQTKRSQTSLDTSPGT